MDSDSRTETLSHSISFRSASVNDLPTVLKLIEAAYTVPERNTEEVRSSLERKSQPGDPSSFLIYQGEEPAGFVLLEKSAADPNTYLIIDMGTDRKKRNISLGKELIRHLLKPSSDGVYPAFEGFAIKGTTGRFLSSPHLQTFLRTLGYEVIKREDPYGPSIGERIPFIRLQPINPPYLASLLQNSNLFDTIRPRNDPS